MDCVSYLIEVVGIAVLDPPCRLYDSRPVIMLNTRMEPSPHPAARNLRFECSALRITVGGSCNLAMQNAEHILKSPDGGGGQYWCTFRRERIARKTPRTSCRRW